MAYFTHHRTYCSGLTNCVVAMMRASFLHEIGPVPFDRQTMFGTMNNYTYNILKLFMLGFTHCLPTSLGATVLLVHLMTKKAMLDLHLHQDISMTSMSNIFPHMLWRWTNIHQCYLQRFSVLTIVLRYVLTKFRLCNLLTHEHPRFLSILGK